jgi:hypothetical protein
MKLEFLFQRPQDAATGSYPGPGKSSPLLPNLSFEIRFNITFPFTPRYSGSSHLRGISGFITETLNISLHFNLSILLKTTSLNSDIPQVSARDNILNVEFLHTRLLCQEMLFLKPDMVGY